MRKEWKKPLLQCDWSFHRIVAICNDGTSLFLSLFFLFRILASFIYPPSPCPMMFVIVFVLLSACFVALIPPFFLSIIISVR